MNHTSELTEHCLEDQTQSNLSVFKEKNTEI